jgi:carbamoyltransferase
VFVLGINANRRGSSACLLHDGQLVAAAEEARFRRTEDWVGFPTEAVRYCLEEARISLADVDHVAVAQGPAPLNRPSGFWPWRTAPKSDLSGAPDQAILDAMREAYPDQIDGVQAHMHLVEHQRSHLASAFFPSPFAEAAVISIDDADESWSTSWGIGRGSQIEVMGYIESPHSLSTFYAALAQWLGLRPWGDEDQVMALAAHGGARYVEAMRRVIKLHRDGSFELSLDLFDRSIRSAPGLASSDPLFSPRWVDLIGPPRPHDQTETAGPVKGFTQFQLDVAASGQAMLELAELNLIKSVQRVSQLPVLCLSGSIALNQVFNGKISALTPFERISVQPAAGDASTAVGAAFHLYHEVLGHPRVPMLASPYTGPCFEDDDMAHMLRGYGLRFWTAPDDELVPHTAQMIANGAVVGWFQGRMEWGPHPLGNRSVLADPRRPEMDHYLHEAIARRAPFVPFGASVLQEAAGDFFHQAELEPVVSRFSEVKPERQGQIPAVTHVDGTAQAHGVSRDLNPRYWHLIRAFEEHSGVPVVLNTSFSDQERVICEPEQAIQAFLRTRMDALVLGNHLVVRS